MTDVLSRPLPPPKRWQEFESLTFDLFSRVWRTTDAELHGRTGQAQAGVDVYGTNRVENLFTGVQCKGKDADYGGELTEKELRAEVDKALKFQPPLEAFIVVTTAPNDVTIQKIAREISAENKKRGLFEVRVTGWDTLRHRITDHPELVRKYFPDFAPVDMLEHLNYSRQDQKLQFQSITQILQRQSDLITNIRDDRGEGDDLATRASDIGKLIDDGSPRAALRALDRLLTDEGETASPLARYRIFATRGIAQFALGNESAGIVSFQQAFNAYPTFPNARATKAIVLLHEGNCEAAFLLATEALKDDPASTRSARILISAAPEEMTLAEVEARLPPELVGDVNVKIHLAMHAARHGDHEAHRRLSDEAYALAPEDWRAIAGVADALMEPLSAVEGLELSHALTEKQLADATRAAELLGKAWGKIIAGDSSCQGRHVAANLISLLGLLGRDEQAQIILEQALKCNSNYDPLAYRSAQCSFSQGDCASAVDAINAVPEDERGFDSLLIQIQAAIGLGDAAVARWGCELLEAKHPPSLSNAEQDQLMAALRAKIAILEGADREVEIEAAARAHPDGLILRSILFDELPPESQLRKGFIEDIRPVINNELTLRERVHSAEMLYSAGQYSLAADLYEPLHGQSDSYALRRRLEALYLADRRAEARKLFESLPGDLRVASQYLYVGINIYQRAGLLKPALRLVEKALLQEDTLRVRMAWIHLLMRLGRSTEALSWLEELPDSIDGSSDELMTLAWVLGQYHAGNPKSLAIGYRALRSGYGQPSIHTAFAVGLILNGQPNEAALAPPSAVGPGTGLVLLNEVTGERIHRLIETEVDPVIDRDEISPNDPFAKQMVGLKVGETIEIPKLGFEPQTYRVMEIQSRYVFAFQRTVRDFSRLFPGNATFGSFSIDDSKGDHRFEEVFAVARRRAAQGNEITTMYRDNVLPLPMVAKFSGSSVFDVWDHLSVNSKLGLKSALGISGEFETGREAADRGIILVDPVSIYAWTRLGLCATLLKSGSRLAVVQATIDLFRQLLKERQSQRGRKMGILGWDGEHCRMAEFTEEAIERQVEEASAALEFTEKLMLLPAETDEFLPDSIADLLKDLEPAYYDTLIASLGPKRALLSDDLGFRVIAQGAGAAVSWTQPFKQVSLFSKYISHAEYIEVIASLIDANYYFTQFNHRDIIGELRNSGWVINDRLRRFARLMTSTTLDRASIATLLGNLLLASYHYAPDDTSLAAFPIAYAGMCRESCLLEQGRRDFSAAYQEAFEVIIRSWNRQFLPKRLIDTTCLTPLWFLTEESIRIAKRQVDRIRDALRRGGFTLG
ncbi:hypothetical protein IFJ82_11365 [Novacetimonas hansenii]|uniref:PIN domain-containing protein n=1 Tax=Novacetimonas hansenii TaxID=436 RepID=UPI00177E226C|nr:hypothetical protein [Novacetimonas hansenii]MBL7235906.1 hypothetical protein [Novacetimonas hansenii]QOF94509.1 hypothetical protein IFJ82_11365 [Novacetimonas hansenii]